MRTYLVLSSAIGLIEIVDAGVLYANDGALTGLSLVFSGVELLWVLVSFVALVAVKHRSTRVLALVFLSYNIAGWLLGGFVVARSDAIALPMWAVIGGGLFGVGYATCSAVVANRP
ncbi:MAG: hypothetical protein ABIQ70_13755 [Dokdonella sp.]